MADLAKTEEILDAIQILLPAVQKLIDRESDYPYHLLVKEVQDTKKIVTGEMGTNGLSGSVQDLAHEVHQLRSEILHRSEVSANSVSTDSRWWHNPQNLLFLLIGVGTLNMLGVNIPALVTAIRGILG